MAQVEILAREMVVQIESGAQWLEIENIESIGHTPTKTDADTGSFSKAGRASHIVAERGDEFTLTIKVVLDDATGQEPPGNMALRELGKKIGHESLGKFRILNPFGYGIEFSASANVGQPVAGGRNDQANYQATLTVSGDITDVTPTP